MRCPVDDETLVISERNGVEIDYCPQCRGVWLDRGELDKIVERSALSVPSNPDRGSDPRRHDGHGERKRKKKSSFLEEIFDF